MKIEFQGTTRERLDKFLVAQQLPLSRSKIQKLIDAGEVTVNKEKVAIHHFLKTGDIIEFAQKEVKEAAKKKRFKANAKIKLKIIDETDDFLIIEKPAGIIVHPTDMMEEESIAAALVAKYPKIKNVGDDPLRPGIVHRLDKKVSGLLLVVKNQKAFEFFKKAFSGRKIKKTYIALVHGKMERPVDEIRLRIDRSSSKEGRMAAKPVESEEGKEAITKYETIKQFQYLSLLKVNIETGRTHQIRAHFFAINHPIVGDELYKQKMVKQNIDIGRVFLHAAELEFVGPDKKEYHYTSPLPEELEKVLEKIQ